MQNAAHLNLSLRFPLNMKNKKMVTSQAGDFGNRFCVLFSYVSLQIDLFTVSDNILVGGQTRLKLQ